MMTGEAADQSTSHLLAHDHGGPPGAVRVLTLNRPDKRNALDTALLRDLRDALRAAEADAAVHAVVLAGAGPAFCAGGDVREFRASDAPREDMMVRARLLGDVQSLLSRLEIPVVAAVQGPALGAGAMLALCADMTIAGEDLSLGFPELADGVVPAVVMASVVHLVGRKLAFEILTTSRRLAANEALDRGLVNDVVPNDRLVHAALQVAGQWAGLDPKALRATKMLFGRMVDLPAEAGVRTGLEVTAATWELPAQR